MTRFFNPGPTDYPRIPIHLAAINSGICGLVGELADGLRMHGFNTPKYVKEAVPPDVKRGLKKSGRSRGDIEICGLPFIVTGKSQAELERRLEVVKGQVSFYGATRTYSSVLDIHGWGDTGLRLFRQPAQRRRECAVS
jgi:alkanesulfonate monooxygenase SsuD/methylene tetrahydromethanopterin reductase-like flavin-dependent oxidoreductase (luciferase family)